MALFETGAQFPPQCEIERLALYEYLTKFYDGKQFEVYERATALLKDTPYANQLSQLYIGCNLADVIATKPSELLLSEAPIIDSGMGPDTGEQKALQRLAQENDMRQMIFDLTVGGAIRGDAFLKVYFNYRQDMSEYEMFKAMNPDFGLPNVQAKPEILMKTVNPSYVFPELSRGSAKDFTAINIAYVEWVEEETRTWSLFKSTDGINEVPYLVVERHLPYCIVHERYKLNYQSTTDYFYGIPMSVFEIGEKVPTGYTRDIEFTGVDRPLVFQFEYKSSVDKWNAVGAIEKITTHLAAIADRLSSMDFILTKHSDPILTGPSLDGQSDLVRLSGAYISRTNEDPDVKYVTWEAHLDAAFKELDVLLGTVFLQAQLPVWLFGSNITQASQTGGGTSHTDGTATKLRYAPVSSLLDRISANLTKTMCDAFYYAQVLENNVHQNEFGQPMDGFQKYTPSYPRLKLSNGIPRDDAQIVENAVLKLQNNLIDQRGAIKEITGMDDSHVEELVKAIEEDRSRLQDTVSSSLLDVSGPAV